MNFIKHYKIWRDMLIQDDRITAQHLTLYNALFDIWNRNRFRNPIILYRTEVMYMSRIGSPATYLRCLKDLTSFRYIEYKPSKNPHQGSRVEMYNLSEGIVVEFNVPEETENDTTEDQSEDTSDEPSAGHSSETSGVSSGIRIYKTNTNVTNSTNDTNFLNHGPHNETSKTSDRFNSRPHSHEEAIGTDRNNRESEKAETPGGRRGAGGHVGGFPSSLREAKAYFVQIGSTELEAKTFFSHYKALGWKVNGSPIQHWQALADKWLIKSQAIAASRPKEKHPAGRLHVEPNKDYQQKL